MFAILHCLILVTTVVEFGNGNPNDMGAITYDYAEVDYLGEDLGDTFSTTNHGNESLTVEQAQHMIKEAADEARHQILNDPELKSFIGVQNKEFLDARRRCMAEDYHYYDYKAQECRNCLRTNCDKNEMCRTECHGILKVKQLNDSLEEEKIKNQQLELKLQSVEEFQEQNEERNRILKGVLIFFAVFTAINFFGLIAIARWLKILWDRPKKPRKVKPKKAESDKLGEMGQMIQVEIEGDGDSGNGSEGNLVGPQTNGAIA